MARRKRSRKKENGEKERKGKVKGRGKVLRREKLSGGRMERKRERGRGLSSEIDYEEALLLQAQLKEVLFLVERPEAQMLRFTVDICTVIDVAAVDGNQGEHSERGKAAWQRVEAFGVNLLHIRSGSQACCPENKAVVLTALTEGAGEGA
jgi:hypothetical protein